MEQIRVSAGVFAISWALISLVGPLGTTATLATHVAEDSINTESASHPLVQGSCVAEGKAAAEQNGKEFQAIFQPNEIISQGPHQTPTEPMPIPGSWLRATATDEDQELNLVLPSGCYEVGEVVTAAVVLRVLSDNVVGPPCGIYFDLMLADREENQLWSWRFEAYGTSTPPCPYPGHMRPGDTVQVNFQFQIPDHGQLQLFARRYGVSGPSVQLQIRAVNPS